jgi:AcrR family transcriptional regulator
MPRIEAESIQAHVERQNGRILDAASELFRESGYRGTDLSDIAARVGLARNSLYRYYASKDHILIACLEREMSPLLDELRALEQSAPDPRERIRRWIDLQLRIAATICHGAMQMLDDVSRSSPELGGQIAALHEPASAVLRAAVAQLLAGSGRDAELVSSMIASMLRSAAAHAMQHGRETDVKEQLEAAVARVLS